MLEYHIYLLHSTFSSKRTRSGCTHMTTTRRVCICSNAKWRARALFIFISFQYSCRFGRHSWHAIVPLCTLYTERLHNKKKGNNSWTLHCVWFLMMIKSDKTECVPCATIYNIVDSLNWCQPSAVRGTAPKWMENPTNCRLNNMKFDNASNSLGGYSYPALWSDQWEKKTRATV